MSDDHAFQTGIAKGVTAGALWLAYITQVRGLPMGDAAYRYAGTVAGGAFIADRIAAMNIVPGQQALEKKRLGIYGLSAESAVEAGIAGGLHYALYQQVFNTAPPMDALPYVMGADFAASAFGPYVKGLAMGESV